MTRHSESYRAALVAAAKYHEDEIEKLELLIEKNDKLPYERSHVPNELCKMDIWRHRVAAQDIRALPIPPDDDMIVVPREPTEAMWGNDLVRWLIRWCGETRPVPESLRFNLLHGYGPVPDWIESEPEFQNEGHVVSKGTRATMIYRAMIAASEK